MIPDFTVADVAEARRLNAKLNHLPRLRMQTAFGRLALNLMLLISEIYPWIRGVVGNARKQLRVVDSLGCRVKVRVFRPTGPCRGVVIDVHGGGWTIGNARMSDDQNAELASRLDVVVVSIDYRLAIFGPIEAQVDDCEAAALWIIVNARAEFGTEKIVMKGASAGAHLAALTILRLRDRHASSGKIDGIMLFFGLYDFSGTSMVRNADPKTLVLHASTVRSTLCALTPGMTDDDRRDPSISPLYADLHRLPPALFVVGEEDMLLEDSRQMEARWRAANGNSAILVAPESPHAFNRMPTAIAKKVEIYVDEWIKERLGAAT